MWRNGTAAARPAIQPKIISLKLSAGKTKWL
jgi:hypothetical protein